MKHFSFQEEILLSKKDAITLPVPVTVTNSRDNEYPVKQNNVALHVK